jgi:hypothetical protein
MTFVDEKATDRATKSMQHGLSGLYAPLSAAVAGALCLIFDLRVLRDAWTGSYR